MRAFIPRFLGAIAYLVVLTVVGTVGYVTIEGWPWQEALYMTVITVTAVGFREVHGTSTPNSRSLPGRSKREAWKSSIEPGQTTW